MAVAASLKYAWALPASLLGAIVAAPMLIAGAQARVRAGVLEVTMRQGGQAGKWMLPFTAITLGHVVIAASAEEQNRLRAHERVHVAQFERWGLLFLVAYAGESLLQFLGGRRPYFDNRFEVDARRLSLHRAVGPAQGSSEA